MVFSTAGSSQSILTCPFLLPTVPEHEGNTMQTRRHFHQGSNATSIHMHQHRPLCPISAGDKAARVALSQTTATVSHGELSRVT